MTGPRERYRQQMRAEAKAIAWEQVAEAGAAGISVNAIAKRMGVSGPALYRYFRNRDDLMTELITDAYLDIADTLRKASTSAASERPLAVAKALRSWALRHKHRYFLINGTPLPGYHAPPETIAAAKAAMAVLLEMYADLPPDAATWRALSFWTRTHGVISLEIAGSFNGMDFDPAELLAAEVNSLAEIKP